MQHNYCDEYERIKLVPLRSDDIEEMRLLRNKNRHSFIFTDIISEEAQIAWYEKYLEKPNDYVFSVIRIADNEFIGITSLYDINNKVAEFGRLMLNKEKIQEKGYGLEAVLATCKIGFKQLNLDRIILEVKEDNIAAYKTYEKAGFQCFDSKKEKRNIIYMEMNKCDFF